MSKLKQARAIKKIKKQGYSKAKENQLCLMTGTAGDRAVGSHDVDGYISMTYFDMLVDKSNNRENQYVAKNIMSKYRVADNMDAIPNVTFYQYDFSKLFAEENILSPSYNKWVAHPARGEAYVKATLGALFASPIATGKIPSIREVIEDEITGIMFFIPRNTATSKKNIMNVIMSQFKEVADGYYIIELTGRTTNGEGAEEYTKEEMKKAKELGKIPLIISAGHIGARSYSIPEINVVVLMYDGGSAASTGQYMSRGLTRGERLDKEAHIISISVDPTRDDSISQAILETAVKVSEEAGENINPTLKRVLRSMNVLSIEQDPDGEDGEMVKVKVNVDEYTAKIMKSRSLRKIVGTTSKPAKIFDSPEAIQKLFAFDGVEISLGEADSIGKKGKTFKTNKSGKPSARDKNDSVEAAALDVYNKIQLRIKVVADNAHNIAALAGSDEFTTAVDVIIGDTELTREFEYSFSVDPDFMRLLLESGAVNGKLLDLIVITYSNEQKKEADEFVAEFGQNVPHTAFLAA
jgi:hypothetical protein